MFGKACIKLTFVVIYAYTAELFPTPVRHIAVGSSSMMSRFGGIIAPFMGEPLVCTCSHLRYFLIQFEIVICIYFLSLAIFLFISHKNLKLLVIIWLTIDQHYICFASLANKIKNMKLI